MAALRTRQAVVGLMSLRHGGLASKSYDREVAGMKDSEILSLVVGIISPNSPQIIARIGQD